MKARISLRAIAALPPNSIIWDTEIHGLKVMSRHLTSEEIGLNQRELACSAEIERLERAGDPSPLRPRLAPQRQSYCIIYK
jgi:hypothetical protein